MSIRLTIEDFEQAMLRAKADPTLTPEQEMRLGKVAEKMSKLSPEDIRKMREQEDD